MERLKPRMRGDAPTLNRPFLILARCSLFEDIFLTNIILDGTLCRYASVRRSRGRSLGSLRSSRSARIARCAWGRFRGKSR
jgi:hypothetical protein